MLMAVAERSGVAEARRLASKTAALQGLCESHIGRIAIVATELATNLVKHAGGGEIAIGPFDDSEGKGLEILALDKGPGISDVQKALADGYSTAGSAGTGLGAAHRAANVFAISTRPGHGTAIMARIRKSEDQTHRSRHCIISGLCVPYPGEVVCDDGWAVEAPVDETLLVLLADGVGHGPEAHRAAMRAIEIFREKAKVAPEEVLQRIHGALGGTRGAAVAVARLEPEGNGGNVNFVGIGNISATLIDGMDVRRMISVDGTVGHVARRIRAFKYPYWDTPTVILHSDGLRSRWDLSEYPGLTGAHPSLIAGVLYRDFRRDRDDASIVVVRRHSGWPPVS
jgi:anti-sigma regulatory factor (Ser/Thr protein kinase)